jgi:V/A-type H+-transporting ATPase subunit I
MAIAKINKIQIIGHISKKDELIRELQQLGLVQIIEVGQERRGKITPSYSPEELEGVLNRIDEAIDYISRFEEKRGLLGSLITQRLSISQGGIKEVIESFDYERTLQELNTVRGRMKELEQTKEKLRLEYQALLPWERLTLLLEEPRSTNQTNPCLGKVSNQSFPLLASELEKEELEVYFEIVRQDRFEKYLFLIYLKIDSQKVDAILKKYNFHFLSLPYRKGKASSALVEIENQMTKTTERIEELEKSLQRFLLDKFKLMSVYDYLLSLKQRQALERFFVHTQKTFVVEGWIKEADLRELERRFVDRFDELAIFPLKIRPEENVPVTLENKRIIQPFEFITSIYGMPKYNEVDPTPFLAPFFFLFFGFCVSDAGYGLMLALICWFALKKFKMGPTGIKFFRLFLCCGISTIIIGALMGSWFGNLFDLLAESNRVFLPLKRFKDSIVILDPLKQPTKLLGIALSFGIIQVWFGNIVASIGNIKNKRYLDIVLDQVPMLTLLFGLTSLGLIFLKLLDNTHISLFKYATLLGAAVLITTQGRSEKGVGSKLFYGVYNLYTALSGYLSDILSYSRLWALGLVTGVMAGTINLIAMQFSQILPSIIPFIDKISFIKIVVSALILIIIFVLGHIVSFLMNLLGAFVHPLRLQFVEFFSKFFKAGGNTFKPFKVETKYINIG